MSLVAETINFEYVKSEFIGSMMMVYITCWCRIIQILQKVDYVETSLTTGLLYTILMTISMKTSGGQLNPATTFALMLTGKVSMQKGLSFVTAQLIGSFMGASLIVLTASDTMLEKCSDYTVAGGILGMPYILQGDYQVAAFISEVLGSALITSTYWISFSEDLLSIQIKSYMTGVSQIVANICFFKFSGACFNPLLIFGPSLVTRTFENYHWLYWFGPVIGALIASYLLDRMEKLRDATMIKKKLIKEVEVEDEIEMDEIDREFEEKRKISKRKLVYESKAGRNYELSDDEGFENLPVRDEEDSSDDEEANLNI